MRQVFAFAACLLLLTPAAAQIEVRDDRGAVVRLARPAVRVISLAPHATEILFAVGAGAQVVGVSEHSDHPPEARGLPVAAGFADLDPERVLALKPDLVVGWISGSRARALERIENAGVATYLTEPQRIADIERALTQLGMLTGHAGTGQEAAERLRAPVAALCARYSQRPSVKVMVQLTARPILSLGAGHFFGELLEICGGRSIVREAAPAAPVLDPERVLADAPEVILFSSKSPVPDEARRFWKRYPQLPAVRAGNLFELDDDLVFRPGPRLAEGAVQVCELLERARSRR